MIRVLNVISGLNNAGTEAVVMNYYRHMDRKKIQFDFLVLDTAENLYYEKEISGLGGNVYKIHSFRKNPLHNICERRKFFKTHKYDIVEVHSPSALRYAYCKSAKKSGAKVIFHVHNTSTQKGFLINFARKQIKKYCDETVTCSQYAARSVLGENADKVVYNAIDYEKYKFDNEKRGIVRNYYNITENMHVIGHIGRFSEQKNQLFLLRAFEKAVRQTPDLRLIMKGYGDLESEIKSLIKSRALDDFVIIADEKFAAAELYNAFDLFVLPSLYEGLPVVAIEAQANGLNVIASDSVTDEIIVNRHTKRIPPDENVWADEMTDLQNFGRCYQNELDFKDSAYNIEKQAKVREKEYSEMAEN